MSKNPQLNPHSDSSGGEALITLRPVTRDNWRELSHLQVTPEQQEFVGTPCYYLCLCHYEKLWQPLAIYLEEQVIGGLMWAIDPADGSCWFGGFYVDYRYQKKGYGRQALQTALRTFSAEQGYQRFALSYHPANTAAKGLYASLGFVETDEWEDDEIVARLTFNG